MLERVSERVRMTEGEEERECPLWRLTSRSTSSARFILAVQAVKISLFCLRSGLGNSIFLSNLPGRSKAGSSVSARFVAMMTFTFVVWSNPSIWFRSSRRMRCTSLSAPVCASNRLVAIASISSMKIIAGAFSRARRRTSRTCQYTRKIRRISDTHEE